MESAAGSVENLRSSISSVNKNRGAGDSFSDTELQTQSSEKTLVEHLNLLRADNPYREFDERRYDIRNKIKEKFRDAPKSVLDQAEEEKPAIEKRLEDTDKALADLLAFGNEIITNIKVANEKRELLRREFEGVRRLLLENKLNRESTETMARYNDIVARWSELGELKEPIIMFNKLEEQKDRIADLMRSKDNMITECQNEIDRINERFQEDQQKQNTDICALVERIDGQIELLKKAYKHHLDLLQDTIESERQTIALKEQSKWSEFYDTMQDNEQYKLDMAKQKKLFYASEIQRITAQQEEITRATRIRLEKDAEMLEFELRNTKNQVLMNSEKLDYNYQVLQKRNEENVIINNQQKRRVAKLSEAISDVKKRIQLTQANAEHNSTKLTNDIQKLHDSITDLEKKSENFRLSNRKKFFNIWSINYDEIRTLIEKVFDIDRILYEHQLGIPWERPKVDLEEFPLVAKEKGLFRYNHKNPNNNHNRMLNTPNTFKGLRYDKVSCSSSKEKFDQHKKQANDLALKAEEERKRNEQRIEMRLLRNILRKVSDRGRFMVEDRLLEFLEPYSEEQKTLVRIDNIFSALRITDMEAVNKLTEFFKPYSFCPNCMKGLPREQLKKLYTNCEKLEIFDTTTDDESTTSATNSVSAIETINSDVLNRRTTLATNERLSVEQETPLCNNHYLIVESAMVFTALNEFTNYQNRISEGIQKQPKSFQDKLVQGGDKTSTQFCSVEIENETISQYWRKFLDYMPKEKQKLWHSLEHGLQHYLEVLKQREQLDKDCAFLRRQNSELKHLLQKFQI